MAATLLFECFTVCHQLSKHKGLHTLTQTFGFVDGAEV